MRSNLEAVQRDLALLGQIDFERIRKEQGELQLNMRAALLTAKVPLAVGRHYDPEANARAWAMIFAFPARPDWVEDDTLPLRS